jgi:hypothetical protein
MAGNIPPLQARRGAGGRCPGIADRGPGPGCALPGSPTWSSDWSRLRWGSGGRARGGVSARARVVQLPRCVDSPGGQGNSPVPGPGCSPGVHRPPAAGLGLRGGHDRQRGLRGAEGCQGEARAPHRKLEDDSPDAIPAAAHPAGRRRRGAHDRRLERPAERAHRSPAVSDPASEERGHAGRAGRWR